MALTMAVLISAFGGKYKEKILKPIETAQNFFFKILTILMWLSPIASFSAMSFLIGKFIRCYVYFSCSIYIWCTWYYHGYLLCDLFIKKY